MKNVFTACLLVALTTLSLRVWGADCSSSIITLDTQAQVDAFQTTYGGAGGCDTVTERLTIKGATTNNLNALSGLTSVGGLWVSDTTVLTSLAGLDNITTVTYSAGLTIQRNAALTNLTGLDNLTSVAKIVTIAENPALTSVDGLDKLTSVGQYIYIHSNPVLFDLNGLASLNYVGDFVHIRNNASLNNLDGLISLTVVGDVGGASFNYTGNLFISNNTSLTNLDGLVNIISVAGLVIAGNATLTNLDGLANLTRIGRAYGTWSFAILDNASLVNLDGLANVTWVRANLTISGNPALPLCYGLATLLDDIDDAEIGPGTDPIPDVLGSVTIENNLPGCNSLAEVLTPPVFTTLTIEKTSTSHPAGTTLTTAAQTVFYHYLVSNTGNVTLTSINLTDNNVDTAVDCSGVVSLAPGSAMTCTAEHTFSQDELDAGFSYGSGGLIPDPVKCPVIDPALGGYLYNSVTVTTAEAPDATDELCIEIKKPPVISGSILRHDNSSPGGAVRLFDQDGNHFDDFWVDGNGSFQSYPLPEGTYYATTVFAYNVIDDVWDGADGAQCPNQLCNPLDYTPIQANNGEAVAIIDFRLDDIVSGGVISGHVEDGSGNRLPLVAVVLTNSNGDRLDEVMTGLFGNYEFSQRTDDTYYVHTRIGPMGAAAEVFDDVLCLPSDQCEDPLFISANGSPVIITGSDYPGVDFVLERPPGFMISGKVTDADTNNALPDVSISLYDYLGNWQADVRTDQAGDYYFSGLSDGEYRLYAWGVSEGYEQQVYNGVACQDQVCDIALDGTPIIVSGADEALLDLVLQYSGTRILGRVTRTDTGEPVSSDFGYMAVNLFDSAGNQVAEAATNQGGLYQFQLPGEGDYYLSTTHDVNFHALINECWDNVKCPDIWDPVTGLATLITVPADTTVAADFVLDATTTIKGRITDSGTDLPIAGIQVDLANAARDYGSSTLSNANGEYTFVIGTPDDYFVFIHPTGIPGTYVPQVWPGVPCNINVCDPFDAGTFITVDSLSIPNIDFALEPGSIVSGLVKDFNNDPVHGARICIYLTNGSFTGVCSDTDVTGYYQTAGVPADSNYVAAAEADNLGLKRQMWNGLNCDGQCDLTAGTPLNLVATDAPGTDFTLLASDPGMISGSILRHDESIPGGALRLFDQHGNYLDDFPVDANGNFQTYPLPTGTYYATTIYTRNAIDDVWDGGDGSQCPNQLCNPLDYNPIQLSSGVAVSDINYRLDDIGSGGVISGHVEDGSGNGLPLVAVALTNSKGDHLDDVVTGLLGNYEFSPRPDDTYYVHIQIDPLSTAGPMGTVAEVFDDFPCLPAESCDDPLFISENGSPVVITGNDYPGVDFVLELPMGFVISGKVIDADTAKALPDVRLSLYDDQGDWTADFVSDQTGDYYFSGLSDGDYRVYARGVSTGYEQQVYNGLACQEGLCDIVLDGTPIVVSGGDEALLDLALQYSGTRIMGTVTRADNGQPIISDVASMVVNLFDSDGNPIGQATTNNGGLYQFHLPGAGDYYLSTDLDANFHQLVNECWKDVKCPDPFDPVGQAATLISVPQDTTVAADFSLDKPELMFISGFE